MVWLLQNFGDFSEPELCLGPALEGTSFAVETVCFPLMDTPSPPCGMPPGNQQWPLTVSSGFQVSGEVRGPRLLEAYPLAKVEATEEGGCDGSRSSQPAEQSTALALTIQPAAGVGAGGAAPALLPEDLMFLNEVLLSEEGGGGPSVDPPNGATVDRGATLGFDQSTSTTTYQSREW